MKLAVFARTRKKQVKLSKRIGFSPEKKPEGRGYARISNKKAVDVSTSTAFQTRYPVRLLNHYPFGPTPVLTHQANQVYTLFETGKVNFQLSSRLHQLILDANQFSLHIQCL
jgi:hypothetical protein